MDPKRVRVHNGGPADATGVTVTTTPLPNSVDYNVIINPPLSDPNVTCNLDALRRVNCEFPDLPAGTGVTTHLKLRLNQAGSFTLTATASSDDAEVNLPNNTTSETTTVRPSSDVSVGIEAPDPVRADADFTYTVTVTNTGPSTAFDTVVTSVLPENVGFVSAEPALVDGFGCSETLGLVTCQFDAIDFGVTLRPKITVRPFDPGTVTLSATVQCPTTSDNLANCPGSSIDNFTFNNSRTLDVTARPRNDNFDNALTISGLNGNVSGSNVAGVKEVPFPRECIDEQRNPLSPCEPNDAGIAGGRSVWYRWVAGENGDVTFAVFGEFDTLLAVYFIPNAGENSGKLQRIVANDDFDSSTTASLVTFNARDTESYYIAIDTYHGNAGDYQLFWAQDAEVISPPVPQHIHSIDPAQVLTGADSFTLFVRGSGFNANSQVRINGMTCNQPGWPTPPSAENCIQTTFRGDSSQIEAHVPARFAAGSDYLQVTVERSDSVSESATLVVADRLPLPVGQGVQFGSVQVNADRIFVESGAARSARAADDEVYSLSGDVNLNDFFAIEGSNITLTINRAANTARIAIDSGSIRLLSIPLLGDVTLWQGPHYEFSLNGSGLLTELLQSFVVPALRDRGIDVNISQAHLLLGSDLDESGSPLFGIEFLGSLKFNNIAGLVNLPPISFEKLLITQNSGLRFSGGIGPFSFCLPCVPFVGGFLGSNVIGVEDVQFSYTAGNTPFEDVFAGSGRLALPFIAASASVEIKGGALNSIGGGIELPAPGVGIQLGPINIGGGALELRNLLDLRHLEIFLGVSQLSLAPGLASIISLDDVGIRYFVPARFRGDANLELFGFNVADVFLDLDIPGTTFSFGGGVDLIPSFPVFEVRGELTAGFRNQSLFVEGFAQGTVQIPDGNGGLYDFLKACGNLFGIRVGPCVEFPYVVASARVGYHNGLFSYTQSLPIIGDVALKVGQVRGALQASVEVFHNVPQLPKRFVVNVASHTAVRSGPGVILADMGEVAPQLIAEVTVPPAAPRVIFDLSTATLAPRFALIAPGGTRITPETAALNNAEFFQNTNTNDSFFVVTAPAAGLWMIEAEDGSQGPFELEAWGVNAAPEINDVAAVQTGSDVEITYNASDADDDARVSLYYSPSASDANGTRIIADLPESAAGSYTWNTGDGSVPAGEYYIYALAEDELNTPAVAFAPTKVTIIDPLAPARPQDVSAASGTENTLLVSWSANTEPDLAGYVVRYGIEQGDATRLTDEVFAGTATSVELIGLDSNTTYRVAVVAFDQTETLDPGNPGQTIVENRYSLPSAGAIALTGQAVPPVVTITAPIGGEKVVNNRTIDITWDIAADGDLFQQQLFVSSNGGATFDLLTQLDPTARQFTWAVPVSVRGDAFRFQIVASDESGNTGSDQSDADISIRSAGMLQFSAAAYSMDENGGVATITVTRTGGGTGTASVHFLTTDGSSNAGDDYEARRGTLTFLDGETSRSFTVPVVNDAMLEPNETINVRLSSATGGAVLGVQTSAVLNIINDDSDTIGPTIGRFEVIKSGTVKKPVVNQIVLAFSEDVQGATNLGNYLLTKKRKRVGIDSAVYDAAARSVTLTLTKPIKVKKTTVLGTYLLAVSGAGTLRDSSNNLLDGDADGTAGGDYVRLASAASVQPAAMLSRTETVTSPRPPSYMTADMIDRMLESELTEDL